MKLKSSACFLFIMFVLAFKSFAIRATTSKSIFYTSNQNNQSELKFNANIIFNWRVDNASLKLVKNSKGAYIADLFWAIRISNADSILIEKEFNVNAVPKQSFDEVMDQLLSDQISFSLNPGNYELEFVLLQKGFNDDVFSSTQNFTIDSADENSFFLSSIQYLDTSWVANNEPQSFLRNGNIDIPLASNYFDEYRNTLRIYSEVYNPNKEIKSTNLIRNVFLSYKPYGVRVADSLNLVDTFKFEKSNVIKKYDQFNIANLTSGNYYVNVVLKDLKGVNITNTTTLLQKFNPLADSMNKYKASNDTIVTLTKKADDSSKSEHILDLTNTFVGKFTDQQVRAVLKMLRIIAEPQELLSINSFLSKPDELYSKYFIYNFWESRNPSNPTAAWKKYADKIIEVNKLFKAGALSGFETDRGRIYMIYGKPNDRIIVNNENGAFPYEVWQYFSTEKDNREALFLFYKSGRSLNDYELLHSTVLGERRNSNWRMYLYKPNANNESLGQNSNSQAEQYIGNK